MDKPRELQGAVCLELPLNVQNLDKAIEAVGGSSEIARVTSEAVFAKDPEGLQLKLRSDPFHHPVNSAALRSRNIVIEIELPKHCFSNGSDIKAALSTAKAQGHAPKVVPKLRIDLLHRFREIADFQYFTGDSHFINQMKKSVFVGDLAEIKKLRLSGAGAHEIIPPPRFTLSTQPFYYGYKQSPYVKIVDDELGQRLIHTSTSSRVISNILTWGDPVPEHPPDGLDKNPRANIKQCIAEVTKLFAARPSYTRRSLQHMLGRQMSRHLKYALPYVSYYYRSGPWRGAYIKYGYDPTTQPSMAKYQVEHFRIATDDEGPKEGRSSAPVPGTDVNPNSQPGPRPEDSAVDAPASSEYKFDGTNYPDVPLLQLCDIADGFLEPFINTDQLRPEVDMNDGWFKENSIAVIRKVLRAELVALRDTGLTLGLAERKKMAAQIG